MRRRAALLLLFCAAALAVPPAPAQDRDSGRIAREFLSLINQQRALNGSGPLTLDARLNEAARAHSEEMVARNFFDHQSPDGGQVEDRARRAGYPWRAIAENISAGRSSVRSVVDNWMTSPGHRDNMLNPDYVHLGVGYAAPDEGTGERRYRHFWTVVFGAPAR